MKHEIVESYNGNKYIYIGDCRKIFPYSKDIKEALSSYEICTEIQASNIIQSYQEAFNAYMLEYDLKKNKYDNLIRQKERKMKRFSTLWINVSNDCNLRCIYCYGDGGSFNRERQFMKIGKVVEVLDFWLDHVDSVCKQLQVIFFGGEPLMNKEAIKFVVSYLKRKTDPEVAIKYGITTNGTILDNDLLDIFIENRFHVTLSIDGGREIQNINRPFVDGTGTFSVVSENIQRLLEAGITTVARLTVTHRNVGQLKQCIIDIWKLGISIVSFDLVSTKNNLLKLTKEDIQLLIEEIEKLGKLQYEYIKNNEKKYIVNLLKYGKVLNNNTLNNCSYESPSVLKVDTNGNIFKCHRLIGYDKFLEGNIQDGLAVNNSEQRTSKSKVCNGCIYSELCTPCFAVNYQDNDSIEIVSEHYCKYMKKLINENIKLYISINELSKKIQKKLYK